MGAETPLRRAARFARRHCFCGAAALCLALLSGCDKVACEGVQGGCLALTVNGTGSYTKLEGVLRAAYGVTVKMGDTLAPADLPVIIQILPPPGTSTALAASIEVLAYQGAQTVASGQTALAWPDGATVGTTVTLMNGLPMDLSVVLDMNSDLNPG